MLASTRPFNTAVFLTVVYGASVTSAVSARRINVYVLINLNLNMNSGIPRVIDRDGPRDKKTQLVPGLHQISQTASAFQRRLHGKSLIFGHICSSYFITE